MNILLTGANGYIGKRLLPVLAEEGHKIYCLVRNRARFIHGLSNADSIEIIEKDLLKETGGAEGLKIDVSYYLVHSMTSESGDFSQLEEKSARNFTKLLEGTGCSQIVYLGGITNEENLSKHLSSRKRVEDILKESGIPVTVLRASIIVGSGSASFEIIRDLVEKLPVMVTPKWLKTKCQPIAIRNVINYLSRVKGMREAYGRTFDIGGKEVLTFKDLLSQFAEVRGYRRIIIILPVLTPRLSSYWLYFVTAVSYKLAVNLVDSMKIETVCKLGGIEEIVNQDLISYKDAVRQAFEKIEQNLILSSWSDALSSSREDDVLNHIEVPKFGCLSDSRKIRIPEGRAERVTDNIWAIGGERGWYYGNFLWAVRGVLDKISGGVGLRRGRRSPTEVHEGDALDFWRVLLASKETKRLLLYAEMKLPGEAWLEFRITSEGGQQYLEQTATFRPRGLWGRAYWYTVMPFHYFVFAGMARNLVNY
ncbi:MAG: SDR family oxidoreductase [Bacteroidetes bacterium]|nr:SDR family oxidoreductase [Bacteroidota bacterium]